MNTNALMTSNHNEWSTPQKLFDELDAEFNFTLDPCATKENAKCQKFFTKKDDGLSLSWQGETVFMNPPYGTEIKKWVQKAYEESQKPNTRVVALIPARVETNYWWTFIHDKATIRWIKGRVSFTGWSEKHQKIVTAPGTFPSAIVIWQ